MIGYSVWRVARAEAKSDSPNETGAAFTSAWGSVLFAVSTCGSSGVSFTLSSKLFKSAGKLKYKLDRAGFPGNA